MSEVGKKFAASATLWTAPDMGISAAPQKRATVGGLADLQAEAHKEAFAQGLAEGREAGRAEIKAQVDRLAGMFYDLAKPFETLDAEVSEAGSAVTASTPTSGYTCRPPKCCASSASARCAS